MTTDPGVDAYIARSDLWPDELAALRRILLDAGLEEHIKWRKPCYTSGGKNVVIAQEMKDFLALMFFKGALLSDPDGILEEQGPNTRAARRITFRSVRDVENRADAVRRYVVEAIEVEDAGLAVEPSDDLVLVDELQERLDEDPVLLAAFEALTPGRRRQYNIHFSDAKKAETRAARIDANVQRILDGRGLRDR